jgi:hypothetical protein
MSLALLTPAGKAQNQPPAPAPPPPQVNPATQAAIAAQAAQAQAQAPASTAPDYPEPRGLTIGLTYWAPFAGTQPALYGGSQATGYETLTDLGKYKPAPGLDFSVPVTRTGSMHVDIFRMEGDGNQYAPANTTILGTAIGQGDYLATNYKIWGTKIYLDDLLFPHKFPVAKFRLKSLWEFQYISLSNNINAPLVPVSTTTGVAEFASGSKNIYLPTFGIAAEYALTPHLLLRADASGFGIFHKADLWDANATVAYRRGAVELVAGAKIIHLKSSPNNTEYISATMEGAFVGLIWHPPLFERVH